jgi:hypothetical protein
MPALSDRTGMRQARALGSATAASRTSASVVAKPLLSAASPRARPLASNRTSLVVVASYKSPVRQAIGSFVSGIYKLGAALDMGQSQASAASPLWRAALKLDSAGVRSAIRCISPRETSLHRACNQCPGHVAGLACCSASPSRLRRACVHLATKCTDLLQAFGLT